MTRRSSVNAISIERLNRFKILLNPLNAAPRVSKTYPWNAAQLDKQLDENFHSNRADKVFKPYRVILSILGRWPFHPESRLVLKSNNLLSNTNNKSHLARHHIQVYKASLKSFLWGYFGFTTILLVVTLLLFVIGFCDFLLGWNIIPKSNWDEMRQENIRKNIVSLFLVWSCLLHSALSSISFFFKRKKIVKYLNYWNVALDQLGLEVPRKIKVYVWTSQLGYGSFIFGIGIIGTTLFNWSIVRGTGFLSGIIVLRALPNMSVFDQGIDFFTPVLILGLTVICYALYSSRAFLMIFRFHVKLVEAGFKDWNTRFRGFLETTSGDILMERRACDKLKEDSRTLLKLVRMTNDVYGTVLQTYYFCQLVNMCFELYYLARSGSYEEVNRSDFIGAAAILMQNVYVFFALSLDAARMSEEAMKGLEIVRTHWMNPEDSLHRKYLVSHMQTVFSQDIVITGSKYFSVDRPFIVTMLGAVFTYFIIILQVGPSLHNQLANQSDEL